MKNFKSFHKDNLLQELSSYEIEDIKDDAFVRTVLIIEVMVFNMFNNLKIMNKEFSSKINQSDFVKLNTFIKSKLTKKQSNGTNQKGGAPVLPSEYFGYDSNRYFNMDQILNEQSAISNDIAIARPAITKQSGGNTSQPQKFVGAEQLKKIIEDYKKSKRVEFTVTKGALDIMKSCIESNMTRLFQALHDHKKSSIVDLELLVFVMVKYFPHFNYRLKK